MVSAGFKCSLLVSDGKGDEKKDGIKIIDAGFVPKGRRERILKVKRIIFEKAKEINAEIYHFHDPELIPVGLELKKLGKKVIYDVHEDVPRQILSKPYIPRFIRPAVSKLFEIYENRAAKRFDGIVAATPFIRDRFLKLNPNTVDVNNFPKLSEFLVPVSWKERRNEICYIGGISRIRGIVELVKSLEYIDITLHLAGNFESEKLKNEVMTLPGWKKVKYYGFVDRNNVKEILSSVKIGVIPLHPVKNYLDSLPIKMFEYMAAGLAVIASDFPLWQEIVEKHKCGICVDPFSPRAIAIAVKKLLEEDAIAKEMGINGRKLVETKYNWETEEKKLISLYEKLGEEQ